METINYKNPVGKIPAHLPKRLTIAFPMWISLATDPNDLYYDLEKIVKEHVERGFNCMRLESGAGLTHDLEGNRLPPANFHQPFGKYFYTGFTDGPCDMMQRLIDLCTICKKYNVFVILSSWYYLHTYWYVEESFNEKYYSIPPKDRFMTFAKFQHYILKELEDRDLADRIACVEIFNEVCDLPLFWTRDGEDPDEINAMFRAEHEKALAFLQENHPNLIFACDHRPESQVMDLYPRNMQAFNGHNYYLWDVYVGTLEGDENTPRGDYYRGEVTEQDIIDSRAGRFPCHSPDWYRRLRYTNDVDPAKIPAMEEFLEKRLTENWDGYVAALEQSCEEFQRIMAEFPDIPVLSGEGISFCGRLDVLWENTSEKFWEMVELTMRRYKEIGLWGTVIKTGVEPYFPSWYLCKDKLRALNEAFLKDE